VDCCAFSAFHGSLDSSHQKKLPASCSGLAWFSVEAGGRVKALGILCEVEKPFQKGQSVARCESEPHRVGCDSASHTLPRVFGLMKSVSDDLSDDFGGLAVVQKIGGYARRSRD
jgi:hypothetical protein